MKIYPFEWLPMVALLNWLKFIRFAMALYTNNLCAASKFQESTSSDEAKMEASAKIVHNWPPPVARFFI